MSIKINDFSPWKLVSDYITPKVDRHIVVGGSDSGQSLLASGIILNNDAGNSALDDIQIKGATETHLFFADVSLDRIGINNDTPLTALDVSGTITATGLDINGDTDISGDLTIVTQSQFDNSTKAATTAYVDAAVNTENIWDVTGTTITTNTAGDDVELNGFLKVGLTTLVADAVGYTDKVGINTATPSHTLDVGGDARIDTSLKVGTTTETTDEILHLEGANPTIILADTDIYSTPPRVDIIARLKYNAAGTSYTTFPRIVIGKSNATDGNTQGYMSLYGKKTATGAQEVIRIEAIDVGIGVADPDSKLEVKSDFNTDSTYALTVRNSNNASLLRLRNDGQVDVSDLGLGDVKLFQNSPDSTTSKLSIYGFVNHDALRHLDISISPSKADTALFDGVGTYTFDGAILGNTSLTITTSGSIGTGLTVNSTKVSTGDLQWNSDTLTSAVLFDATGAGEAEFSVPVSINGITKIGDGGTTNYSEFEADGTLEFNGTATVWNDLQFPLSGAKVPAANYPSWETFTANTNEYAFAVDDYIDTQANEIPHWWKQGTAGNVHLHITTKAANATGSDRFAKFTIYVGYCDTGEAWQETSFTQELTIPDGTAALEMFYLDMGDLTLTNYLIEAEIKLRVKRIAATGGTEYAGTIFLTQAGIHLEKDTVGSRTERTK